MEQYRPIDVVAIFGTNGIPIPVKFKIYNGENSSTVKIDKIMETDNTFFYCGDTYVYKCRSIIRNCEKIYRIMYNIPKCKWYYVKETQAGS